MPPRKAVASSSVPSARAYSVKAKKVVDVQNPQVVRSKNGRLMVSGTCPETGAKVTTFVSKAQEGGFLPFLAPLIAGIATAAKAAAPIALGAAKAAGKAALAGAATKAGQKLGERVGEKVGSVGIRKGKGTTPTTLMETPIVPSADGQVKRVKALAKAEGKQKVSDESVRILPTPDLGANHDGSGLFMPGAKAGRGRPKKQAGTGLFMPGGRP
jgi:hypothetical protein